jgi:hypothetical protein
MPNLRPEADADVITAGREPRPRPGRPARLARLALIAETVVLAGSVATALHYRGEDRQLGHGRPVVAGRPGQLPRLTSVTLRLPSDGNITGTVLITAATQDGAQRARFVVSATILGGRPGTVYDLTGNDCSAGAPVPDHVWAAGVTNAAGTAELAGHPWTGPVADAYWLTLTPSPVSPPPGLRGAFPQGTVTRFPAGQAPCAQP